jgi:hypothetical protein
MADDLRDLTLSEEHTCRNNDRIRRVSRLNFSPHAADGGLDFLLEANNQFAISIYEHLFGFDVSNGLLFVEGG